jgi:hypothetical protein
MRDRHDLRQLREGVPAAVPPRRDLRLLVASCPKCGSACLAIDPADLAADDDPGFCFQCAEPVWDLSGDPEVLGRMEEAFGPAGGRLRRVWGDDALDGAARLGDARLGGFRLEELLYGLNDDSPLGNNFEGSRDNDLQCLSWGGAP